MKTLTVKMTVDQLTVVKDAIKLVSEKKMKMYLKVSVELLVADGLTDINKQLYSRE